MPKARRTKPVSLNQVAEYVAKSEEFVEAAADEFRSQRYIASTSLAIHAAINAADAVCGARIGRRAAGQDHYEVLSLLQEAGADGVSLARDLQRLLPLKTRVEYEPDAIAQGVANKTLERAQRCVAVARAVSFKSAT